MMAAELMTPRPNPNASAGLAGTTLVLGMGATGASAARFLAARHAAACFVDTRPEPPAAAAIRAALPDAPLYTGELPARLPDGTARVLVSPGVPLSLPLLATARRAGLPVESDIDWFMREAAAPVVGVTGSNGKSTVTSMVGWILAGAGVEVRVGGNLGTPALDLLDERAEAYVLELSSFQLERSAALELHAAVVLNVSPDHLDQHADMAAYIAAKGRIYAACATAVVNRDAPELAALASPSRRVVSFGLGAPEGEDFGIRETPRGAALCRGDSPLALVAELQVTGRHNVANALAALALACTVGGTPAALAAALRGFRSLPHRMQIVSHAAGVTWIDDSKATNVGAAVTSIASVDGPFVLIAGGDAKGASFEPLAAALAGRDCHAVLLGRDREPLAAVLQGVCPVEQVTDMASAVRVAARLVTSGGTVLLAPACSSLDMFASYAARGEAFRNAVRDLFGEDPT